MVIGLQESIEPSDEWLQTAATLVPLKTLRSKFLHHLCEEAEVLTLFKGQVLFETNSYDRRHYYLLHGQVELLHANGAVERVRGSDTAFPLAHETPRACQAVAITDCSILSIDSDRLDCTLSWSQVAEYLLSKIAAERDFDEDVSWMQTVLNSNLFFKVPPVNVDQIFSRLTPVVVMKGDVIVRQGEIGDCCYFIKEGTAKVTRYPRQEQAGGQTQEGDASVVHLADIGVGRCFGEDALVYETVRNAKVTMATDGVLMRLDKVDFLLLLKSPEVSQVTAAELEASEATLVDVRTEEEYAAGHLQFAANIPLHLLSLKKRLLDTNRDYILYCDTGRRSHAAAHLLTSEGFRTAALEGGLRASGCLQEKTSVQDYLLRNGQLISSI